MNSRAVCVMISMAAACFHASLWAEMVVRDVAIHDLAPESQPPTRRPLPSLLLAASNADYSVAANNGYWEQLTGKPITPSIVRQIESKSLDVCSEVENQSSPKKLGIRAGELMMPAFLVLWPLKVLNGIEPTGQVTTTVTRAPMHGTLIAGEWSGPTEIAPLAEFQYFKYVPTPGFIGKDKIGFDITVNGKTFRALITVNVVETWDNGDSCAKPGDDRGDLSESSNFAWELDTLGEILPSVTGTADQWLQTSALSTLIANFNQSMVGFSDLAGSSVGQTKS